MVSLNEATKRLDVNTYTVRQLIIKGILQAQQIVAFAPFQIESSELEKQSVKEVVQRLKSGLRFRNIEHVNDKQQSLF